MHLIFRMRDICFFGPEACVDVGPLKMVETQLLVYVWSANRVRKIVGVIAIFCLFAYSGGRADIIGGRVFASVQFSFLYGGATKPALVPGNPLTVVVYCCVSASAVP